MRMHLFVIWLGALPLPLDILDALVMALGWTQETRWRGWGRRTNKQL